MGNALLKSTYDSRFFNCLLMPNAALSGEQRRPPHLNHCAVNTKAESNRKCRALGIRLKRFVMHLEATTQI
ncbi:hypothetical protein D1115_09135 [Vibrio alfacsensis]|uniref:DUF3265 domain-containing protein n=1 Tax=Vibrio alfacsensis TaxID=1074311 RepID=A0ABM6YUK6_9VIBR|nr:hypothetical protein D1115_09135 [Vibrio alfacsensis]